MSSTSSRVSSIMERSSDNRTTRHNANLAVPVAVSGAGSGLRRDNQDHAGVRGEGGGGRDQGDFASEKAGGGRERGRPEKSSSSR